MHWVYLAIGGAFEIGWVISLKYTQGFTKWMPMVGYAICGLGAAYFLSLSMKTLPMAVAYAIWMAIAVVGAGIMDTLEFGQGFSWLRVLSLGLIVLGVGGLKLSLGK